MGRAQAKYGRLDVMVDGAGIGGSVRPEVESEDWDWDWDWDCTFAVLVRGVLVDTKRTMRALMEHADGGSIVDRQY